MQLFGEAVWLEFPAALRKQVEARGGGSWTAALHGVGHLFVSLVRLFVLCDADDVGTEHVNEFEQRIKPNRVTIFERREGGSGLVPEIVKVLPKLIEKAWTIASECLCSDGCPACIQSAGCSEFNHRVVLAESCQGLSQVEVSFAVQVFHHPPSELGVAVSLRR
ncbi:putative DEAD/DEAH box RNA helicase [Phytophthora cinnamomi]|uniref:putative DEAD/DEAH box RNA helicase n=1 Tax=Phytophthora cinnamomi TaxID=4785 RepID=UPI00355A3BD7|nr:putative DEAD/DEAH box RNA helicase [Phytophthora cinnamomi]